MQNLETIPPFTWLCICAASFIVGGVFLYAVAKICDLWHGEEDDDDYANFAVVITDAHGVVIVDTYSTRDEAVAAGEKAAQARGFILRDSAGAHPDEPYYWDSHALSVGGSVVAVEIDADL